MNKYKLLPHQKEALKAVTAELKKADRCHIVMACGTGKTLTSLAIAENINPKSIVVFVPSLALINQFMKEWIKNTNWKDYETLAVCSDNSVTNGIESDSILLEDMDFSVTSDVATIKKFLNLRNKKLKIIFCTYQSSILLKDLKIELGIFDEAHKTAGYGKNLFAFSLHNENIKISKRLFMTATPRHASAIKKDKNGEAISLYSMDNMDLYGKRAFTLGFRKAINLGLICDYKIIISVANANANANSCLLSNSKALQQAIVKSKTNKIITYHKSIKEAKEFSLIQVADGYKQLHISSKAPMSNRSNIMQTFRDSKKTIICNSRCLTEGVDVPAIDMVAFLNPKTSKIDIVQAIGRALRKSAGKEKGYVFLPIFLDSSIKDHEEAIAASDFSHIWEVLNAMAEQDSDLNDVIKKISKTSGEARYNNYNLLNNFIEISGMANKQFLQSIQARIISKLYDSWDYMYGKLLKFKKENGHLRIQCEGSGAQNKFGVAVDKKFGQWVGIQRNQYNKGLLAASRVKLLNDIGFIWGAYNAEWMRNFEKLRTLYEKHDNCHIETGRALTVWMNRQRNLYRYNKLQADRINLLNTINFPWKLKETPMRFDKWMVMLNKYKNYNGYGDTELTMWGHKMRQGYKRGQLPQIKIEALRKINFDFDGLPIRITEKMALEKFLKIVKNDPNIIFNNWSKNKDIKTIASWLIKQRKLSKEKKINQYIKRMLNKSGYDWLNAPTVFEGKWEQQFQEYKKFKKKNPNVADTSRRDLPSKIFNWVRNQRKNYGAAKLSQQQIKKMEEIGFSWGKYNEAS